MSNDEFESEAFELWNLPDNVCRELSESWDIRWLRWLSGWLPLIIMSLGLLFGWKIIWPFFEELNFNLVQKVGLEKNATFYVQNIGFGLVALLFAWLTFIPSVMVFLIRITPKPYKGSVFFGVLSDANMRPFNSSALQKSLNECQTPMNSGEFIRFWANDFFKRTFKYSGPLILIGFLMTAYEIRTYEVYSAEGIHHLRWPWNSHQNFQWTDVETIDVGCNQVGEASELIYRVKFNDGAKFSLENLSVFGQSDWLLKFEKIDTKIRESNAYFQRWKWLRRDPLHPKCVEYFKNLEDGDRYLILIRANEL